MKLEEAIRIGEEEVKHPYSAKKMGRPDALKLLIEAGRREMEYRPKTEPRDFDLLPGETK